MLKQNYDMQMHTRRYLFTKKIINREALTYIIPDVSFPDFDAVA